MTQVLISHLTKQLNKAYTLKHTNFIKLDSNKVDFEILEQALHLQQTVVCHTIAGTALASKFQADL